MRTTHRVLAAAVLLAGCAAPPPAAERAETLHRRAMGELSRGGDPAESLAMLDEAIRLDPVRADLHRSRSLVHRILGRMDGAIADLTGAAERESNPVAKATDLLNRALLHEEAGRAARALADVDAALEAYPDYVEAWLQRARLLRANDRGAEAARALAEARHRGASLAVRFYNEGIRLLRLGQPRNAARMLSFSVDLDERKPDTHVALGRAYMELRRFGDAELAYGSALALRPDSAPYYYHRGNARLAAGRFAEALEDFDRSAKLDPNQPAVLTSRGRLLEVHRKDRGAALKDYTRAIELDPAYRPARIWRGRLHFDARRFDPAEQDLLAALRIRADGETTHLLARVAREKGDLERAGFLCDQALKMCNGDADLEKRIRDEIERIRAASDKK